MFWIFFIGGFGFPSVVAVRWYRLKERPNLKPYAMRGLAAGLIGIATFGSMMLATRIGKVAEVAAIRETSIIFATAIGYAVGTSRGALELAGITFADTTLGSEFSADGI